LDEAGTDGQYREKIAERTSAAIIQLILIVSALTAVVLARRNYRRGRGSSP
jgi:hypothetical protein